MNDNLVCDYPKIKGVIFVSKYMDKKYGFFEAVKRIAYKKKKKPPYRGISKQ